MIKNLQKSLQFILEAFFPSRCLICQKEGAVLCEKHYHIPENKTIYQASGLEKIQARTDYKAEVSKRLIYQFKFRHQKNLAPLIAKELLPMIRADYTLIPVPLHWSRKLFRGFNQCELIIHEIQKLNPEIRTINFSNFKKVKNTNQQALLNKSDRLKNLNKAFVWKAQTPPPEKVLLIDDIMTSGATLSSAAKALNKAGSKQIRAVVFAHG